MAGPNPHVETNEHLNRFVSAHDPRAGTNNGVTIIALNRQGDDRQSRTSLEERIVACKSAIDGNKPIADDDVHGAER